MGTRNNVNDDFFFIKGLLIIVYIYWDYNVNAWPPILLGKFTSAEILQFSPELRTKHHPGEGSVVLL